MKKKYAPSQFFFVMFGIILLFSAVFLDGQKTARKAPPFHTGGELFPEPVPAPPPAGPLSADNPMMQLARPKNFSSARVSSFARNGLNLDTVPIPLGGEEVTIADIKGPGAITHIWTTYKGGGRDLIIRFYWDGSEHPSIEAPIGDFFGVAMGFVAPMSSFPIQCTSFGRSRNCWWYMPFNKSAKVTLSNLRSADYYEKGDVPIEHWPWISEWPNTGRGYYSSLGFWYQKGLHKPWPRLEKLVSDEPWDPTKGRWHITGAMEAENLGILSTFFALLSRCFPGPYGHPKSFCFLELKWMPA